MDEIEGEAEGAEAKREAPLAKRLAIGLVPPAVLAWLSFLLPEIPLDTAFADFVVFVSDTAYWGLMPWISIGAAVFVVTRPGLTIKRRVIESGILSVVMVGALAGVALLNEHVVKPAIGTPRPNIEALAEAGALGEYETGAEFYALGSKNERREAIAPMIEAIEHLPLSQRVREHWAHETGYTFPSGHSTGSMSLAALMVALGTAWMVGWRRRVLCTVMPLWALCVVYSRPLLRVHRPIDVAVGTLQGIVVGLLAFGAIQWLVNRIGHGQDQDQTS